MVPNPHLRPLSQRERGVQIWLGHIPLFMWERD
jgi:hypothetical protein